MLASLSAASFPLIPAGSDVFDLNVNPFGVPKEGNWHGWHDYYQLQVVMGWEPLE